MTECCLICEEPSITCIDAFILGVTKPVSEAETDLINQQAPSGIKVSSGSLSDLAVNEAGLSIHCKVALAD